MPTVREIIQAARWEDPSFTDRRHTAHVLRSRLAEYQAHLVGRLADVAAEEFAEDYLVLLPLDDFTAGHELVTEVAGEEGPEFVPLEYLRIMDEGEGVRVDGTRFPVRLIPYANRWERSTIAPAWVRNGRLYLGGQERDWVQASEVRVSYVPMPPSVLTDDDQVAFGNRARSVYTAFLAAEMAGRFPKEASSPVAYFRGRSQDREDALLHEFVMRHEAHDRVKMTR